MKPSFIPTRMRPTRLAIIAVVVCSYTIAGANAWVTTPSSTNTNVRSSSSSLLFLWPKGTLPSDQRSRCQETIQTPPSQQQPQEDWWENSLTRGRNLAATASLAGLLLLSPPPSFVESSSWWHPPSAQAATATTLFLLAAQQPEEETVFDEVYNLIDKYFIDRTYGGQVRMYVVMVVGLYRLLFMGRIG